MENLQPGKEYPISGEQIYINKIVSLFKKTLASYYPIGVTRRIFHPKMHGLVRAEFIVPQDLNKKLCEGLFQPGACYEAWIRLSNAKKHADHDKKKDMRGMAIKLLAVPGKKILNEEAGSHDFVLVTAETVQTRSVKDFHKSLAALMGSKVHLFFYAITHLPVVIRSLKQISKCSNLLEVPFFSTTPYRFGDDSRAVKYAVIPQAKHGTPFPENPGFDFLREQLVKDLSEKDHYFDFMIQFQEDPERMPIEDPTVKWNSPLLKVATIRIPKQDFDATEQIKIGENFSFTPWHALEAHRPLGGVNRARKDVYEALSDFRHLRNLTKESVSLVPESLVSK